MYVVYVLPPPAVPSVSFSLVLTRSHSFSLVLCRSLQVLSAVRHDDTGVFKGLPQDFDVVRYHSLVIDGGSLPDSLRVTAWVEEDEDEEDEEDEGEEEDKGGGRKTGKEGGDDGGGDGRIIMGVAHVSKPLWGVQFHPESISTQFGTALLRRFREGMFIKYFSLCSVYVQYEVFANLNRATSTSPPSRLAPTTHLNGTTCRPSGTARRASSWTLPSRYPTPQTVGQTASLTRPKAAPRAAATSEKTRTGRALKTVIRTVAAPAATLDPRAVA